MRSLGRQRRAASSQPVYSADQIAWSVTAVAQYVPGASCLAQALALSRLLAKYGHEFQIDIGVRKPQNGNFAAHAWVRHSGEVILGGSTEEFRLIASYPPDAR